MQTNLIEAHRQNSRMAQQLKETEHAHKSVLHQVQQKDKEILKLGKRIQDLEDDKEFYEEDIE